MSICIRLYKDYILAQKHRGFVDIIPEKNVLYIII